MLYADTYNNKKVFITGHTGFKGSWLTAWLHSLNAVVKGYSLAPEPGNDLFDKIEGSSLCESVIADIMDNARLEQEILSFQPDFIFHLAAQPLVRLSYDIPVQTFAVNSIGTAHVLEAVRKLPGRCHVVCITTDKVYHNNEWLFPYRENDRLGGYDPYSASKACAEILIDSYRNSFFNPAQFEKHLKSIAVARAGNVIGGGDMAKDRIIPDTVKALQDGQEVVIRHPRAVRPWQHVLEPLSGYLLLGQHMAAAPQRFATAYNFGPFIEDNMEVEELVKEAIKIWGRGSYEVRQHPGNVHEAGLLKLDISKALVELQWRPKWDARQAISHTIAWYKNASSHSPLELMQNDIRAYEE